MTLAIGDAAQHALSAERSRSALLSVAAVQTGVAADERVGRGAPSRVRS